MPRNVSIRRGGRGYVEDLAAAIAETGHRAPVLCLDADNIIPARDVQRLAHDESPLLSFGAVRLDTLAARGVPTGEGAVFAHRSADGTRFGRDLASPTHLLAGCHRWSPRATRLLEEFIAAHEPRWGRFLDHLASHRPEPTLVELSFALNLNTPDDLEIARRYAVEIDH